MKTPIRITFNWGDFLTVSEVQFIIIMVESMTLQRKFKLVLIIKTQSQILGFKLKDQSGREPGMSSYLY